MRLIVEKLIVDPKKTFGTLKYVGEGSSSRARDDEGNLTDKEVDKRLNLRSDVQKDVVTVVFPVEVEIPKIEFNQQVELIDPDVKPYSVPGVNGRSNTGFKVTANGIKVVQPKKAPENNQQQ